MDYEVSLADVESRPTAVVATTTTWQEFPALWGELLDRPCPLTGRVAASALPAGTAARTVHHGPFGEVGAAHDAVLGWCAAHGHRPNGIRWEVYGPHNDDPARQWTEVYWLVR